MKRNPLIRFIPFRLALIVAPLLAAWPHSALAANQSWDGGSAGTGTAWYTLTNWAGDAGFPGATVNATAGSGAVTDIATLSAGTNTGLGINMNTSGGLTLGAIDFGRTNTSGLTIGNSGTTGGAGFLELTGATLGSANTLIRCTGTTANLTIAPTAASGTVPTTLRLGHANGLLNVATGRTLTISAVITGSAPGNGYTKTGLGTVVASAANTYDGLTTVNDGVLQLRNATAAGTGSILLVNTDGAASNNNDVLLTGGLTYGYDITLENGSNQNARTRLQSASTVNANANTWAGNITFKSSFTTPAGNQTLIADSAPLIINGNLLQDATLPTPSIFIRGGNAGTINGNIFLNTGNLFKTDSGTWTISSTGNTMASALCADGLLILNNNDAIPATATVQMGQGSATTGRLQINAGFTQQLAGISTSVGSTSPSGHSINGPGSIDFGTTAKTITVEDNTASSTELTINAPIAGSGGFNKSGIGNLLVNSSVGGPVTVNAGGLAGTATISGLLTVAGGASVGAGTLTNSATLTAAGVDLAAGSSISVNAGSGGTDLIANTGTLTSAGTTFNVTPNGSFTTGQNIPLIGYTGTSPGTAPFTIAGSLGSRAAATVVDLGSAIGINITSADKVVWVGGTNVWDIATTSNWKLLSDSSATTFQQFDSMVFDDSGGSTNPIAITGATTPVRAEFTNTMAVPYTITGPGSMGGSMVLDKTGDGTVTLNAANSYTGATNVSNGRLIANMVPGAATATAAVIPAVSPINVTGAGIVQFGGDNNAATAVATAFPNVISGNGTVEYQPRMTAGATTAVASGFNGNSPNFSGSLKLLTPASGTGRLTNAPAAAVGTATIEVQSGNQFYTAGGQTYNNSISIAGTGFADANGNLGALRLENNSNWAGPVVVDAAGARICSHNGTALVSGPISGGPLEVNVSNYNNAYTVRFSGTNSYTTTVIGGGNTQTAGVPSYRLNIGDGGTTGTLGSGTVTINGDGANGVLGFDRSDGYTLGAGNTITAGGSNIARTFVDFDCRGAGFDNAGVSIDLGTAGNLRTGVNRANAVARLTGTINGGNLFVGVHNTATPTTNAALTLGAGVAVSVNTVSLPTGGGTAPLGNSSGASLNIDPTATLTASTYLYAGDANTGSATVNHAGTVTVGEQVRVGHWPNAASTYNMNSGSLTLTGASPTLTPSTAGGGAANSTGDNNINALPANTIVGGGIYIGNDGTGILNHSGGTITTNWIVLDNRTNSTVGGDGIDRYNISGSAVLKLRSEWGLIARNVTTDVSLGGGTIQLDNTGTGGAAGNTGADLDVPLDAVLSTVSATTTILDTNGADNSFILTRNVTGDGALDLMGGGSVELRSTGTQTISAILAGNAALLKSGTGSTVLSGASGSFTGATTVSAGALTVNGALGGAMTVQSGGTLDGSGTVSSVTVQSGGVIAPGTGTTAAPLAASSADLQSGSRYDADITAASTADKLSVSGALTANGTIKVTLTGYVPVAGDSFDLADAASFAGSPAFDFSAATLSAGLAWDTSAFLTTGVISVVTDDPFTAWATSNGVTEGKAGDDDKDGATNLLEFATNANPKTNGSGARAYGKLYLLAGENVLTLTIAVRKNAVFSASGAKQSATQDKVIYTVEASDDLAGWNSVVVSKLNATDSAAVQASLPLPALEADWEWHTFRTDDSTATDPRDVIRLSVTAAP